MLETWERAEVDRLEKRVNQLERKNWERSLFAFRLVMYGYVVVFVALVIAAVVLAHSHPGH